MEIKIKRLEKELELPKYARDGDAAIDLRSREELVLTPGEKKVIATGIKVAIPKGYAGLIWDRGGLAGKHGLHIIAGVVDSNYRGEIFVAMLNLGQKEFKIEKGMRIAQMLIQPVETAKLIEVDELDETNRGENKFSSSGLH